MKTPALIIGFLSLVYYEFKRMLRGSYSSYLWFILLVFISTYSLFAKNYVDMTFDESIMTFKYGEAPMGDILVLLSSYIISSSSEVISGTIPDLIVPISIGVVIFILFPLMLGLTLIGKFIIKKATITIAGEKEKKTLYILVASSLTRPSIFIGKFIGIFLLTLPMIFFLYMLTYWAFTDLFPGKSHLIGLVLSATVVTALLFSSIGMMISVLWDNEKKALWAGTRVITAMAALTSLWILIPLIDFILNLTDNSTYILLILEKITHISPLTMDLLSVYNPAVSTFYFSVQIILTLIFFILGIVIFIRQDLEY